MLCTAVFLDPVPLALPSLLEPLPEALQTRFKSISNGPDKPQSRFAPAPLNPGLTPFPGQSRENICEDRLRPRLLIAHLLPTTGNISYCITVPIVREDFVMVEQRHVRQIDQLASERLGGEDWCRPDQRDDHAQY
jgi:hypothetical protein